MEADIYIHLFVPILWARWQPLFIYLRDFRDPSQRFFGYIQVANGDYNSARPTQKFV